MTPEQESELLDLLPRLRELVSGSDSTLHYHSLDRSGTIASLTDITDHDHSLLSAILGAGSYHLSSGAATAAETLAYGTYTPTSAGTSNLDSATFATVWGYLRVGNTVVTGGTFSMDPTAAGRAYVDINLPIASASPNAGASGASFITASNSVGEPIAGTSPGANVCRLNITAVSTADNPRYAVIIYQVN